MDGRERPSLPLARLDSRGRLSLRDAGRILNISPLIYAA